MIASPTRTTTMKMKRWTVWLLLLVAVLSLARHFAHALEQTKDMAGGEEDAASNALQKDEIPEFVPTNEWQDVLPGQGIPPGLHVRLNLATGKREAKFITEDDEDAVITAESSSVGSGGQANVQADGDASVTVTTDVSGEISGASVTPMHTAESHALAVVGTDEAGEETEQSSESEQLDEAPPVSEPNWNHDKIYEVLQALPEPPDVEGMDIHEAHAKLSKPEFRRQMIKLWKKRQAELKEAIDSLQDDSKYIVKLLDQFREAEKNGDIEGQLRVLEVLEWEVQDLDKTHVFNFVGGFGVIAGYLNSTNLPVRAHASWLVGTAVKNYKDGQDWAISSGALPKLVDSLSLPSSEDNPAVVHEVKKKAVYALSSIVRFNPRGQRLLLSLDGPAKLSQLLTDQNPMSVQLKAVLFAHDLLHEVAPESPTDADSSALQQLQDALRSPEWCGHTATFLTTYVSTLQRNQVVEIINAMHAQLPTCKQDFSAANVKASVESIQASWRADTSLDEDEREDLVANSASLLAYL